jgi:outer membrane protein TolC
MRLPALLSVALVAVASLRAEAPPLQGTMPEDYLPGLVPLLKTAVERSPNTISAAIAVDQAESGKIGAFSNLYPHANANGSYAVSSESETNSATSTSKGLYYGAGINGPVFQWGAIKNAALVGSLGLQIANREYADAYRTLAITLRELRNEEFKLRISEENMDAEKARFESGSVSEADLQGYRLDLESATLNRDRTAEDFAYSKLQFIRLVGVDNLDDAAIPLEIPHPEFSASLADAVYSGFVGKGIESTFQSQVYDLELKQDDLSYKIAKVGLLPKLSFSANYAYSNYTAASVGSVSQVGLRSENVGISAGWNIFDGFATTSAKLGALAIKRAHELQLKSYVDATVDSVGHMHRELGFSARALALAEVHFALIDSQVKRLNGDKALGYASQATIDSGTLTLDATEFDMVAARSGYLGSWTEFVSLAGLDPAIENISPRYDR